MQSPSTKPEEEEDQASQTSQLSDQARRPSESQTDGLAQVLTGQQLEPLRTTQMDELSTRPSENQTNRLAQALTS